MERTRPSPIGRAWGILTLALILTPATGCVQRIALNSAIDALTEGTGGFGSDDDLGDPREAYAYADRIGCADVGAK